MVRSVSFTSPYDAQQAELERKAQYAEALRQQGLEPIQGGMAGRVYVGPSWTQGLAQMLKVYGGRKGVEMANQQSLDLANQRQRAMVEALRGFGKSGDPNTLLENPDTAALGVQGMMEDRALRRQLEASRKDLLTPEQVKQLGLPEGTVAQIDASGALSIISKPEAAPSRIQEYRMAHPEDPNLMNYDAWVRANRAAGASQINNYGSPVEGVNPQTGESVFFQTSRTGGAPVIVEGVVPAPKSSLSSKDQSTAIGKIQAAQNLKRQIAEARRHFETIKGTLAAGPLTGLNPFSEPGQKFDAAIDALRSTVTALTRTPGVGSMSDFETKLDQSKIPSRGKFESVTEQQLNELEALADGIIQGYGDLLGVRQPKGATGSFDAPPATATAGELTPEEMAEMEQLRRELGL